LIEIKRYESELLSSNMYVIVEGKHAIVIDPFEDTVPAQGLKIDYIILTHEHYDHISGVNIWKEMTGAPVLCSKACAENIKNPKKNLAYYFKEFCELQTWMELDEIPTLDSEYSCSADQTFENEIDIKWWGHVFKLFEIPGHSLGSIGIMLDGKEFFSGDSLLENSEIDLRMPGGSRKKWKEIGSKRIKTIPEGTRIWPGHFKEFCLQQVVEDRR
jgi:hydroxyacylglutathione hydrolase